MHASAQPVPRVRRIDFINQLTGRKSTDRAPAGIGLRAPKLPGGRRGRWWVYHFHQRSAVCVHQIIPCAEPGGVTS
jgi:hypothetical protein